MSEELLYFNGIDGDTGSYDLPPMSAEELMRVIRGEATPENLSELRFRVQQATTAHLGVKEGVDATKLGEAGWGVIFPQYPASERDLQKEVDAIREALQPLPRRSEGTGKVAGIEAVGIGTDFDGFTDPPDELRDASELERLTQRLIAEGYDEEQIGRIWGGNALRVLREGWGQWGPISSKAV